jgi:hypothetical protein
MIRAAEGRNRAIEEVIEDLTQEPTDAEKEAED